LHEVKTKAVKNMVNVVLKLAGNVWEYCQWRFAGFVIMQRYKT
jgi:hypothetical protein